MMPLESGAGHCVWLKGMPPLRGALLPTPARRLLSLLAAAGLVAAACGQTVLPAEQAGDSARSGSGGGLLAPEATAIAAGAQTGGAAAAPSSATLDSADQAPVAEVPAPDCAAAGPLPLDFRAPGFRESFRRPLPAAPLNNPPGQKRVGLQAGHWLVEQVPPELARLQPGTSGGGRQEWQVNLDVAQRAAQLLEAAGVQVDVLPATVPQGYKANAFVAVHADGDLSGSLSGFKVARPGFSSIPSYDDQLVAALNNVYGRVTGLARDDLHISLRMTYYYAFNSRRYCHAVAPGVPQAIIETGFLTNASDRTLLIGNPDVPARGIAEGVLAFLSQLP